MPDRSFIRAGAALALLSAIAGCGESSRSTEPHDWENPAVTQLNREPARASFSAFESAALAATGDPSVSAFHQSLNGAWKFNWVRTPAERPAEFWRAGFDASAWPEIEVPGNWELQGYGIPHYINIEYVFPPDQPTIPHEYNPVGSYLRDFEIPAGWDGRRIYIHFGAVNSAFYLWVNGDRVGYSQDSKLPAEFDITEFTRTGTNRVAVEVYRWSDGSYLEDQDAWSMSGIERDVFVVARPRGHLRDFTVTADLADDSATGVFGLELEMTGSNDAEWTADVRVADGDTLVFEASAVDAAVSGTIDNVKPWTAETPYLYELSIVLTNVATGEREFVRERIGFRNLTVENAQFLVNGVPVTIRGVNRHEHDPTTGRVVSRAGMLADVLLMKQLNVNAVRTSHYPNDPYWYQLADEYGLYVMDEANIESHEYMQMGNRSGEPEKIQLGYKPEWELAHVERMSRMVERDKNHASIIWWSMGNEAGIGPAFEKGSQTIRDIDPSRPVVYGGWGTVDGHSTLPYVDVYTPMYDFIEELLDYADSDPVQPLIQAEYAHAMGNSVGNLQEYWDVIYAHEALQGGHIWDWVDQTLYLETPSGKTVFGYGGDFGESPRPDSDNFLANGVIQSDRTLNPHAWEVKKVYQPISFEVMDVSTGRFRVHNRHDFIGLAGFQLSWTLEEDGQQLVAGRGPDLATPARASTEFEIELPEIDMKPGAEYFIRIAARAKAGTVPLLDAGYLVAWDQFDLPNETPAPAAAPYPGPAPALTDAEDRLVVAGDGFEIRFSTTTGEMVSWVAGGKELLLRGLRPDLWRAPTDNDSGGAWAQTTLAVWKQATYEAELDSFDASVDASKATVTTRYRLGKDIATYGIEYRIAGDGTVRVRGEFEPVKAELPVVPRVGMNLVLKGEYSRLAWFGRGPHENYADRKSGAAISYYEADVADQYHDYSRPQETGNKTDVRWMMLTNAAGDGLRITGDEPLSMTALPLETADLDHDRSQDVPNVHGGDIVLRDIVRVNIDLRQMGVGGDNSWGAQPLRKYKVPAQRYEYAFLLEPVAGR